VSVEVSVRTLDGDGLDTFLAELADDFRGWKRARTWRSLERDLTLSARHSGRRVHLTWGLHDRPPSEEWHFEAATEHAPGEAMHDLARAMGQFLTFMNELGFVDVGAPLPADPQASEAVQPGKGSLDHPAMRAESVPCRVRRRAMAGTMPRVRTWSR
jgi:hypothetical protein